ncbi:hypothetical protein HYU89_00345 [Candidatus Collierbacteria bacterium]|nr:hypothetical protein [Candidatus Collierbacteria bacterium]
MDLTVVIVPVPPRIPLSGTRNITWRATRQSISNRFPRPDQIGTRNDKKYGLL